MTLLMRVLTGLQARRVLDFKVVDKARRINTGGNRKRDSEGPRQPLLVRAWCTHSPKESSVVTPKIDSTQKSNEGSQ